MSTRSSAGPLAAAVLGIVAVFGAVFARVRATNFSGYDEWLYVHMASRGIVGWPFANRPLVWLWHLPPAWLWPNSLDAYFVAYCVYLVATALAVFALCLRLGRDHRTFAFLAGVFTAVWAPMDHARLDAVGLIGYAGFTMGTALAVLLLAEAHARRQPVLLAAAAALALVMPRGTEATLPVLALAGTLPWWLRPRSERRVWWTIAWAAVVALGLALALRSFAPGALQPSYQAALGLDPHPLRVAGRLRQFRFHLLPLVATPLSELAVSAVPIASAVFAAFYAVVAARSSPAPEEERGTLWRMAALGVLLAAAGYAAFVLTSRIATPVRTQILSAPGIAILLASLACLVGSAAPARLRPWVVGVAGAWVVAVGAARTAAMQRDWDVWGSFPAQNGALVQLTRALPDVQPNTMIVLLDEAGAFPATFTFRHAVEHLYQGRALGLVWGASDYLYPCRFTAADIQCEPWEVIRREWRTGATRHRYDEVVVARLGPDGRLVVLESWPPTLPGPAPAGYRPWARIRPGGAQPAERGILKRAG
jgi:hypothetical protein